MRKFTILSFILAGIFIYSCISPSEPEGIKSKHLVTIDTGGYCRDIDIKDSLLVAAADENGYQVYEIVEQNGIVSLNYSYGDNDIYNDGITEPIESVIISAKKNLLGGNLFFILDYFDAVYYCNMFKPEKTDRVEYDGSENREFIRSITLDDSNQDHVILYALKKDESTNSTYISIRNIPITDDIDSTIVLWWTVFDKYPNLNIEARDIHLADSLLSVANSQLGVIVLKQNNDGGLSEFISFDTPGEVNTVYSMGRYIFAGLSDDKGCSITLLDSAGGIINTPGIADGYSIKGIHLKDDILALACGNDGVLLYNWYVAGNGTQIAEMGWLDSEYAYNVKVYNSQIIFVATRSGIQVFQLER